MENDGNDQEANPHSQDKWWEKVTATQRRIGEALVLILYFVWDGLDQWPTSHSMALILGVAGSSVVLLIEISLKRWAIVTAIMAMIAAATYWVVGPEKIHVPDVEVTGSLQPGNGPTPSTGCDNSPFPAPANTILFVFGDTGIRGPGDKKFPVIDFITPNGDEPVLAIQRNNDGLLIDTNIFDSDNRLIARVRDSKFDAIQGENSSVERRGDLSTLVILGKDGTELLYIKYVNPKAVVVRGRFVLSNGAVFTVTDKGVNYTNTKTGMKMANYMSNSCLTGAKAGIGLN